MARSALARRPWTTDAGDGLWRGRVGRVGRMRWARAPRAGVDVWENVALPLSEDRARTFMETYWQKKPLLMRRAIANFVPPMDANEIAGLACEEDASARLFIREGDAEASWRKSIGPFDESELASLPSDGTWSLIVNDLDAHAEPFGDLLELFSCFPRWRVSDIQASVSPNGGGVGPHSDHFDVFLLQAEGEKHWAVADNEEYWPDNDRAFVPECEIRVLKEFVEDDSFTLVPGDMLYLPPKVAHNGVAVNSAPGVSVTLSIGFLAPTTDELILSYTQRASEKLKGSRWSDPWLKPAEDVGAISADAISYASDVIKRTYPKNDAEVARWFGCHVTARTGEDDEEEPSEVNVEELLGEWDGRGLLAREDLRFAFVDTVADGSLENALFFANGACWDVMSPAATRVATVVANRGELFEEDTYADEKNFDDEALKLVLTLFEKGYLYFPDDVE
ncbi:Lysine-specific demethylase NO66/MYC-induced nuclear antigen [Ostreococcus tauri]|uniref:Bifunctional lysine-specific demethylase and histidyl-hydroxylase n=1 Tax=Ostreococcus tauri TaxID=70448 RepID=A0A090M410_OSTTA|nr:Lysine-specific demethylase NO66/MYC-induced nuclear antigen [Ostreococcus tauri]CEF98970.1 Lysine-specific demethylase NO66/MYC-induced nuclear antigen [Ostreococcus tauri]|eukprot:XP_003081096.2 Lysine-specific demethylase NO66/MYC-induced nuclear antigen [Ostreococcus tauri]